MNRYWCGYIEVLANFLQEKNHLKFLFNDGSVLNSLSVPVDGLRYD